VQTILRDVSERLIAERALRGSEERFRAIFAALSDGVLIHDRDGALIEVNESACHMFGLPHEVLLRMDLGALVADGEPQVVERIRKAFAAARESGRPQLFEWRARRADGDHWWAEVRMRTARIAGRERVLGVVRDVTERRAVQEALGAARNRLDHLLSTAPTVIYSRTPDPSSELTFVSRNVSQLLGRSPELLLGDRSRRRATLHKADRVRVDAELADANARGDLFSCEYRVVKEDGSVTWIQDDAQLLRDPEGRPLEWVGSWRDVSKRRQSENRQRLMVDELDHRVKNTLATVLALLDQPLPATQTRAELQNALRGRVKALARTHEALARERWEAVDVDTLAGLVLGPHIELGRISLHGQRLPLDPRMASPLGLALHELATNAVKHGSLSTPDGSIAVLWLEDQRGLVLSWREHGGPPCSPPKEGGTGLRLLRGLIEHELSGQVVFSFDDQGLGVEIVLPTEGGVPRPQLII
jgi:PAS domain S-box-containing protein